VSTIQKAGSYDPSPSLHRACNRLLTGITEDIPEDRWQANMLAMARVIDKEAQERR